MTISAALVGQLREKTGASIMDCKRALEKTNGDIAQAIDEMRKLGQSKAEKKAGNTAAEGAIFQAKGSNGKIAVLVETNSQTDFAARDENFVRFGNKVAEVALNTKCQDVNALMNATMGENSVEQARQALVAKIGENIQIRRLAFYESEHLLGVYCHGNRIGVLVELKNTQDETLAKQIAMHIAASQPVVISSADVSDELIEKEKSIFQAQAENSGKPADIIKKMVDNRIKKYLEEISLLGQPFVMEPSKSIAELLKEKGAEVVRFVRFEVGEGIEKEVNNFAEEVMAQVKTTATS